MSGEFENKNSDYLSYFGLNFKSSVEEKAIVFSKTVVKISFDINNELMNNPNYRYGDIEKVNYLTQLRNDILQCDKKAISDSLNMRFDYICIKCRKENGNMISERYIGSYYSGVENSEEFYNRVIQDLIPYLLPQQKEEAIRDIKTIKKEDLQKFVELFIAVYHGDYVGGINAIKVECDNSNYEILKKNGAGIYRYLENGFTAQMTHYNINGSLYYKKFSETVLPDFKLFDEETNFLESMDKRRYELIVELLMDNDDLSPKDDTLLVVVTNMDFYSSSQPNISSAIEPFNKIDCLSRRKDANQYKNAISNFKSLGAISIEISKRFGTDVDIYIHIPDNINDYQEKILMALKEKMKKIIDRKSKEKTKKNSAAKRKRKLGFLDASIDYSSSVESLIDMSATKEQKDDSRELTYSSVSIANLRMAIRTIDMRLITRAFEKKKKIE